MAIVRAMTLITSLFMFRWFYSEYFNYEQKKLKFCDCLLLIFAGPLAFLFSRTAAESFSSLLLISALVFWFRGQNRNHFPSILFAGFFLELIFEVRLQVAILPLTFILLRIITTKSSFLEKQSLRIGQNVFYGVSVAFIFCRILDGIGYQQLTLPALNYFFENIILAKSSLFGKQSWNYYFGVLDGGLPWFSIIALSIAAQIRNPRVLALNVSILIFVLLHIYIDRKDSRFMIPLLPFAFLSVCDSYFELWKTTQSKRKSFLFLLAVSLSCLSILGAYISPKQEQTRFFQTFNRQHLDELIPWKSIASQFKPLGLSYTMQNIGGDGRIVDAYLQRDRHPIWVNVSTTTQSLCLFGHACTGVLTTDFSYRDAHFESSPLYLFLKKKNCTMDIPAFPDPRALFSNSLYSYLFDNSYIWTEFHCLGGT